MYLPAGNCWNVKWSRERRVIELIAFDADDTLWHNESLYRRGLERFNKILARYEVVEVGKRQHEIEINNLQYYGYGVSGFVLSLIEAAIELTNGQILGKDIKDLVDLSKEMLTAQVELFEHVEQTLEELAKSYRLVLVTKGDLRHQESKVARSGVKQYFQDIAIVSDKTPETYSAILMKNQTEPTHFLMVGDSLRSDILPVIQLGGRAVYIPNHGGWDHERVELSLEDEGRFFEIEHLGLLPDLVKQINSA